MDKLKNCTLMSLGCNCTLKSYIKLYIDQPTYIFDWIGSPMWGINKLINNNFDLFNNNDYGPLKIYNNKSDIIYCNKKYFFKFIHDLQPDTDINANKTLLLNDKYGGIIKVNYVNVFKKKYQRRIDSFIELLNSHKLVVFLRLEENMNDKLFYDEYKESYSIPEIDHIQEYMNILKNKYPKLNYKLIYFTKSHSTEIKDNLLIIHDNININNEAKNIDILMNNNKDIIDKFIIIN